MLPWLIAAPRPRRTSCRRGGSSPVGRARVRRGGARAGRRRSARGELPEPADGVVRARLAAARRRGCALGLRMAGLRTEVRAVHVNDQLKLERGDDHCGSRAGRRGLGADVELDGVEVVHGYLGDGLRPRDAGGRARRSSARAEAEGLELDPVYTGKTMAAVLDRLDAEPDGPALYWHTYNGVVGAAALAARRPPARARRTATARRCPPGCSTWTGTAVRRCCGRATTWRTSAPVARAIRAGASMPSQLRDRSGQRRDQDLVVAARVVGLDNGDDRVVVRSRPRRVASSPNSCIRASARSSCVRAASRPGGAGMGRRDEELEPGGRGLGPAAQRGEEVVGGRRPMGDHEHVCLHRPTPFASASSVLLWRSPCGRFEVAAELPREWPR